MNIRWHFGRSSILIKIFTSFLLVIIPIYTVSLYMNESGRSTVNQEIHSSMTSRVHFYIHSFEMEMNKLNNFKNAILFDDDVLALSSLAASMSAYEQRNAILRVQNQLLNMKDSSQFVKEIRINIPGIGCSILTDRVAPELEDDKLQSLQQAAFSSDSIVTIGSKLEIADTYPKVVVSGHKPGIAVEIQLDTDKIRESLAEVAQMQDGGAVLMGKKGKWSLSSADGLYRNWESNPTLRQLFYLIGATKISGQSVEHMDGISYLVTSENSDSIEATLLVYIPETSILGPLNKYRDGFYLLSILSVLAIAGFSLLMYRNIHQPVLRLVRAFRQVERGDLEVKLGYRRKDEFGYLYGQFNQMMDRLDVLVHQVYEQQLRSQRSELKQLQSQINPHFLYNSLYYIYQMAEMHEIDNVSRFSRYLGDYFQFLTRTGSDEVSLRKEAQHAIAYLEIQIMRFSNRIRAVWDEMPEEAGNMKVPRLIIQPLLENAFQHGLESKVQDGLIAIRFREGEEFVRIEVEDNGEHLSDLDLADLQSKLNHPDSKEETTGLLNVHRRLQLKYGPGAGLTLDWGAWGGLRVTLSIPKVKSL